MSILDNASFQNELNNIKVQANRDGIYLNIDKMVKKKWPKIGKRLSPDQSKSVDFSKNYSL
mgnify:CR=1 FL=1